MSGEAKNPSSVKAHDDNRMATDTQIAIRRAREGMVIGRRQDRASFGIVITALYGFAIDDDVLGH